MNTDNSMYIDTDTFDFFALDDVKSEPQNEIFTETKSNHKRPTISAENVDFSNKGALMQNEDEESFEEFDPEMANDLVGNSYAENDAANKDFHSLEDWALYDLGHVQFTKKDVIDLVDQKARIQEERAFFDAASRADYEEVFNHIQDNAARFQTETELTIQAITEKLNSPYTSLEEKGELYDRLNQENNKLAQLNKNVSEIQQSRLAQEQTLNRYRVENTRNEMYQIVGAPEWKREAQNVFAHALANGATEQYIQKNLNTGLALSYYKAYKWDQAQAQKQAKTKQALKDTWTRSKSSSHAVNQTEETKTSRQKQLDYKRRNGGLSADEHRESFNFLVD